MHRRCLGWSYEAIKKDTIIEDLVSDLFILIHRFGLSLRIKSRCSLRSFIGTSSIRNGEWYYVFHPLRSSCPLYRLRRPTGFSYSLQMTSSEEIDRLCRVLEEDMN